MRTTKYAFFFTAIFLFFGGAFAQAATVTGTVTDRTTGKPAVGDAVVLVEPMSGMSEVGRATTDAHGRYSLNLTGSNPYLIRVTHQGADFFIPAPPNGGTGDIPVYDVAAKVSGVSIGEHVTGVETDNGQLRVVERYEVHNASTPPTTQWSKKSFAVVIPDDAAAVEASAQRPGTGSLPTSVKLDPDGAKGHYAFNFPIQPDEGGKGTLFQVQYELPYSSARYTFHSVATLPVQTDWIVLPKAMTFTAGSGSTFESSPQDPTVQTFLTRDVAPGKLINFAVAGTGSFPREDQGSQGGPADTGAQAQAEPGNQPGGGIGAPIDTPDPLSKYKWWILGGLALLLAAAAGLLLRKQPAMAMAPVGAGGMAIPQPYSSVAAPYSSSVGPAVKNTALLNALKEELFALESEKIAGTLGAEEYVEQKAALETVLRRALKRNS